LARQDGFGADGDHRNVRRYVEAQLLYFAATSPLDAANVVIDNTDVDTPRISRRPMDGRP
jgi:uridine kinase